VVFVFIGAQEGCAVFLDKKVTKKSSQQKCFFAHKAFHAQSRKNCGLEYFCLATLSHLYPGMQKFPMPCPAL
jgi:hypothetical protein